MYWTYQKVKLSYEIRSWDTQIQQDGVYRDHGTQYTLTQYKTWLTLRDQNETRDETVLGVKWYLLNESDS